MVSKRTAKRQIKKALNKTCEILRQHPNVYDIVTLLRGCDVDDRNGERLKRIFTNNLRYIIDVNKTLSFATLKVYDDWLIDFICDNDFDRYDHYLSHCIGAYHALAYLYNIRDIKFLKAYAMILRSLSSVTTDMKNWDLDYVIRIHDCFFKSLKLFLRQYKDYVVWDVDEAIR